MSIWSNLKLELSMSFYSTNHSRRWVCGSFKSDLSSTTEYHQNHNTDFCKLSHLKLELSMSFCSLFYWPETNLLNKKTLPSSYFRCDIIHNCHRCDLGNTLLCDLTQVRLRCQKTHLRWVCWPSKSELSSTTKCDPNHISENY